MSTSRMTLVSRSWLSTRPTLGPASDGRSDRAGPVALRRRCRGQADRGRRRGPASPRRPRPHIEISSGAADVCHRPGPEGPTRAHDDSTSCRRGWRRWWSTRSSDGCPRPRHCRNIGALVEQDVDVALTIAEQAYVLETALRLNLKIFSTAETI